MPAPTLTGHEPPAPQPVVPPSPPRRSLRPLWIVLVILVALPIVAVVALAGLLVVTSSESSEQPVEIEFSGTEPDADLMMNLTPAGQTGASVELKLRDGRRDLLGPDRRLVAGSAELTAIGHTPYGRTELLQWTEEGDDETFHCWGSISSTGSAAFCADPRDPQVVWGATDTSNGTIFDVEVAGLPADAAWLVTRTWGDGLVASPVVGGRSFQQWPPDLVDDDVIADARSVTALDSAGEIVWQQSR